MTQMGQGGPPNHWLAAFARGAGTACITALALAWSLILATVTALLTLTRGFLFYPLCFVAVGGTVVAGVFALTGAWADAGSALLVAFASGCVLAVYGGVALKLNPKFFARDRVPWWWLQ